MLSIVLCFALSAAERSVDHEFQSLEWKSPASGGNKTWRYRLHVPAEVKDGKKLPLLVWCHGWGEGGSNNKSHIRWLELVLKPDAPKPLFILAWQHPRDTGWLSSTGENCKPIEVVDGLIQHVLEHHPIDADRVYLSGVCEGGDACWALACEHPDRFAAIAPLAPVGGDPIKAHRLAGTPVWVFFSANDHKFSVTGAQRMVKAIQDAGSGELAYLTMTSGTGFGGHDCWTPAFEEHDLMQWMLAQRRGGFVWWPPGWAWWQSSVWLAIGLSVLVAFYALFRRHGRRRAIRTSQADELAMNDLQSASTIQT